MDIEELFNNICMGVMGKYKLYYQARVKTFRGSFPLIPFYVLSYLNNLKEFIVVNIKFQNCVSFN